MLLRSVHRGLARIVAAGALVVSASAAAVSVAPAAHADSTVSMESQFVAKMNAARQASGLRPYSVAYDLTSVARQHSAEMAQRQSLYHNPNLTTQVQNWQAVGENVGEGPSVTDIHDAFMHSPEHRANILDHDFTQVGVGVSVDGNGVVWVTEDFRQPMHSTSTAPAHHSAPTHHTTTTTTARAPTHHAAAPVVVRHASAPRPHVTHHVTAPAHPAAAQSPQAQLLARITAAQTAVAAAPSADPVAQAFDYLDAVSTVTG